MAAAPVHQTAASSRKRSVLGSLVNWVSTKGCKHALKLRHSFPVDTRTRVELGLDVDIVDEQGLTQSLRGSAPWAAMLYQFDEADASRGALELNPLFFTYNRRYRLGREGAWWEVPLDTKLGLTYAGKPHIEVGIGNVPLMLTLATLLLATGKSVGVTRKEVGSLAVHFPITSGGVKHGHSLQERLEVDATLRAEGRGLRLDFQQLNGVLRLRQD